MKNVNNYYLKIMDKRILVKVPIELIIYLNEKIAVISPSSATRLMAFEDLIQRYLLYKAKDDDMAINFQQLSEAWGWGRSKTTRFLMRLQEESVISIDRSVNNKVVRVKPNIICSVDATCQQGQGNIQFEPESNLHTPSLTGSRSSSTDNQGCT